MYRRMGYTDLIARDAKHYVELVVELASDTHARSMASQRILASCDVLFNDRAVVTGFEAAICRLLDAKRQPSAQR
jgi:predicted O-linked N-acetylglucosamine transferase (SPINDLY family)